MPGACRNIGVLHILGQKGAPCFDGEGSARGTTHMQHRGEYPDLLCRGHGLDWKPNVFVTLLCVHNLGPSYCTGCLTKGEHVIIYLIEVEESKLGK